MDFIELVKTRFSVRKFTDKAVEKEKLEIILATGNAAPTAKNLQPQRIYVLKSEDALTKLDSLTHCRYGAGTVLLFTYNTDEDWKNPLEEGVHSGIEDVSIVATHIMLQAAELGLGSCWCNYFANSALEKLFGLPENEKSVLVMPVGYADQAAKPSPMHSDKRPIEDIIRFL
ncbi:MAG: nitroreductase family protein [Prevotella sp.]|nr:nitroreductase family protein [Prevotella sp.]